MISILLPTRRRPQNIDRFINSLQENAINDIEFIFFIDDDDELTIPKLEKYKNDNPEVIIKYMVGTRQPISNTYNLLVTLANKDANIFVITGDDIECQTFGWDEKVIEAFNKYNDRLVLVGGKDLFNESLFTTFCLSKEWLKLAGFLTPLNYYDFCDTFIWDVFSRVNRIEKIDIIMCHHHPSANPTIPIDQTMKEKNLRCYGGGSQSSHILYEAQKGQREKLAEKLRKRIEEFSRGIS